MRILGAFYLRLVGKPLEVYQYLEPLLNDPRKIRKREPNGGYTITYVDEVIDNLLTSEHYFEIALPFLTPRYLSPSLSVRIHHTTAVCQGRGGGRNR